MSELRCRLSDARRSSDTSTRNADRKQQVGSGQRSDKIRTVADQRARVENHLNGKRMSIDKYLRGFIEEIH